MVACANRQTDIVQLVKNFEFLVQQGILGVIAYGGVFLAALRDLRISAARDPRALAVFLGLTGYLICSLFTFQHVLSTPFAFALLGMAEGVLCKVILIKF